MSYENINILQSNICRGPQSGTICTIDTTSTNTVLRIKNMSGGSIMDLTFSSNIITTNPRIEYVGPYNLSTITDDLTFFTFEKVSSSVCMIKRWATRIAFRELLLKEQIIKSNTGDEYYNCNDFAVEYYHRSFTQPNEYYNYLNMNSTEYIKTGTKLFLGPSTDTDNIGATEVVTVSHIIDYMGGKRVYLTSPIKYQYVIGDPIIFYNNIYLYSQDGFAGDTTKGTLYKVDAYSWATINADLKAIYKKITAARWCPMIQGIASIVGTNMLFVRPYDSYQIWRSQFLNNIEDDYNTIFSVYDIMFDNYSIYKLQRKTTLKDDLGERTTYSWSNYNLQADTLLPYNNSMAIWSNKNILTGQYKNIDIYANVRDQFHIGLRDVDINFSVSGDSLALLDPLDGLVTTDIDGYATINYRSGYNYTGHTLVSARAAGSSSSTGSQYVWAHNNILSFPESGDNTVKVSQKIEPNGEVSSIKQIFPYYKVLNISEAIYEYPSITLRGKSFFTSPGGDWGPEGANGFFGEAIVQMWLPMYYKEDEQYDAPASLNGKTFSNWPYPSNLEAEDFFIGNQIKLVEEFNSSLLSRSRDKFLLYSSTNPGVDHGFVPRFDIKCPEESGSSYFSQLKLSLHTYWADGIAYDYLWTHREIDQFIFVEDAIPKFYSEKNPASTNVWVRLRPFAFSLNISSLRMWVREISYYGDTGYREVTDSISIDTFDAGGGNLGLEVTYNPGVDFYHNSLVYIRIEVYDIAPDPNFIYTEYWFKVIPDYKAPYVNNLAPDVNDIGVSIHTTISFDIIDDATGVDIDSLECLLNSRRMKPEDTIIERVSRYHYKVSYTPPESLYYNKDYKVTIKVNDLAPEKNALNYSYNFYTIESSGITIIDEFPSMCKAGMDRFQSIKVTLLASGDGIDANSVYMQVSDKNVNPKKIPILYRIS